MKQKKWYKYEVVRTIQLSQIIEAPSKTQAIEWMYDKDAKTKLIRETATRIKDS